MLFQRASFHSAEKGTMYMTAGKEIIACALIVRYCSYMWSFNVGCFHIVVVCIH